MQGVYDLGLRGRLPLFIKKYFFFQRNFRLRVESTHSDLQNHEENISQGSIQSVTLFSIKINNIVKCLNPTIDCALYVICYRVTHMNTERQLQLNHNKINQWAIDNDFKFSKSKTQCVHFCSQRKMHNDSVIKLEDTEVPVVDEFKFLEVIFDKKLTFIPRIKYLKTKSTWTQQLLRVVAHTEWGADRQTLLKLYRLLIHSELDNGISIYRSARKYYIKELDLIHHEGPRLFLDAFRTSSVDSLYTEAQEAPLQLRYQKLTLQYNIKIKSCPSNPAYDCIFNPKYKQYSEKIKNQ